MRKLISWFSTPAGKKFTMACVPVVGAGVSTIQLLPHTVFLDLYQQTVSMYHAAQPVPLANSVRKYWDTVVNDMSRFSEEGKKISDMKPFTIVGFDLFHAGIFKLNKVPIIGLPISFTYTDPRKVDTSGIIVNGEPLDMSRKESQELINSLVLSEDAILYGIGREISMAMSEAPIVSATISFVMIPMVYVISRRLNSQFHLFDRHWSVRGYFYCLAGMFHCGLWITQQDLYNVAHEKETDHRLSKLGEKYVKGGVEFYEKLQNRNKALRSLLGSWGESLYTPTGNERHFFRHPRIAVDKRKEFFEKKLIFIQGQSKSPAVENFEPQVAAKLTV